MTDFITSIAENQELKKWRNYGWIRSLSDAFVQLTCWWELQLSVSTILNLRVSVWSSTNQQQHWKMLEWLKVVTMLTWSMNCVLSRLSQLFFGFVTKSQYYSSIWLLGRVSKGNRGHTRSGCHLLKGQICNDSKTRGQDGSVKGATTSYWWYTMTSGDTYRRQTTTGGDTWWYWRLQSIITNWIPN